MIAWSDPVSVTAPSFTATGGSTLTVPSATGLLKGATGPGTLTAAGPTIGTTSQGGTVTVSSDGSFTYTPKSGFTGTDTFAYTATDTDGSYATGTATIMVNPAIVATTTSLRADHNPGIEGGQVTYTATVSPIPDGGTVAFTDGTTTIAGCSNIPVTSTGTASCTTTYTTVGNHTVTATFSGDTGYQTSTTTLTEHIAYGEKVLTSGGYTTWFGSVTSATIRLTNATGTNESSSHVQLHATALDGKPIHGAIGTRTSNFPYDPWLHAYTFLAAQ